MRLARSSAIALGLAATLALTACGDDGADPETDPAAAGSTTPSASASDDAMIGDATFTATEYGFDGPDTLPAGKVTITLKKALPKGKTVVKVLYMGDDYTKKSRDKKVVIKVR